MLCLSLLDGIVCVLQKMKVILINQLRDQLLIPAGRVHAWMLTKHDVKETWIEYCVESCMYIWISTSFLCIC